MSDSVRPSQLVVIGSSAGGIEALSTLVSTLSDPFPSPIVIAQHLDPSRPSHLEEILARRTPLPVVTVRNKEPLLANTIYVVPSNNHVQVTDHDITLLPDGDGRPRPSVDLLLSSAAEVYGERLVAVILTGTGSDGAIGARAVKGAGGTVIIQNPETAAYPGMPQSLDPQIVDITADLPRIGPILSDLLNGVKVTMGEDEEQKLEPFLAMVHEKTGIDFRPYKAPTIVRRLQRRIVATGTRNLAGYIKYLEHQPDEYRQLASSFLIKVTDFMRDPDLFNILREKVIPDIVARSRERNREIRLWSAGCATGEEAYSLAILVMEALGNELSDFEVKIFATDLDTHAISVARQGVYTADAVQGLSDELVRRYFAPNKRGFEVRKQVRSLVVFGDHDLGQRAPFPRIDMVLCRNVLIYFAKGLQQRALHLFAFSLREGGYLVLGKTETVTPASEYFIPEVPQQKIYRRHGQKLPLPILRIDGYEPARPPRAEHRLRQEASHELFNTQQESLRARLAKESLLLNLPVGVIIVNNRYDIVEINIAARRLLSIHTVAVGEDLVHLAQNVPNKAFRLAIDRAIREKTATSLKEVQIPHITTGEPIYVRIDCYPQGGSEEGNGGATETGDAVERVLILVTDITKEVQSRKEAEESNALQVAQSEELTRSVADLRAANASLSDSNDTTLQANSSLEAARLNAQGIAERHRRQMEELVETNREILAANEDLTRANAELNTKLDDFQLTNEEAHAAIEETETLNEEMQATNEELETLNEELQATVEELHTSNADLVARGYELENLAASLEAQQSHIARGKEQLEAILAGMADAVIVVNPQGEAVVTNAAYERLFDGINKGDGGEESAKAGKRLADESGKTLSGDMTPQARAARGESFTMTFTLVGKENWRWFEAVGQPVRGEGEQTWGVAVIRDITERQMRLLQEQFIALASHELRTPVTVIKGYLQLVTHHLADPANGREVLKYLTVALAQTNKLQRLINDLLDVSRLDTSKLVLQLNPMRLDTFLHETIAIERELGRKQGIELSVNAGEGPLIVNGDSMRLQQVILNLLSNAAIHAASSAKVDVRLRRVGDQAEIEVQDYGNGIPPEHLSNVFTRFHQVKSKDVKPNQGLGLGLFISREIVELHGGTITVSSTVGEGTAFAIQLPLVEKG